MALTVAGLKSAIIAEWDAIAPTNSAETGEDGAQMRDENADALAKAIVNYITANAVVNVTTTTTCGAGAGTGTGSGTIS